MKLKEYREKARLSQKEVAEILNCKQQNISRWEKGIVLPQVDKLKKLAELYGCKIDDLI